MDDEVKKAVEEASVIVIERLLLREIHESIQRWREQGKFVVASFDDAYHLLPKSGGQSENTWRGGRRAVVGSNSDGSDKVGAILNQFRDGLRLVDTALVPSKILASDYEMYCPTIQYVPNFPYLPIYQNLKKRPPDGNFVIGYGGSTAHWESWRESGLAQGLGLICKRYARVHFHLQSKDPKIQILLDKAGVRYTSHYWVAFDAWPQVISLWDLYVAPLTLDGYDLRRSYLKAFESALCGMPLVATCGPVYEEARGVAFTENRAQAWFDAIARLIDNREEYERLAREGREWAVGLYEGASEMYERALGIA